MVSTADYLTAVLRRSRDGMPPQDFQPDWADAPRPGKLFRAPDVIELPSRTEQADRRAPLREGIGPRTHSSEGKGSFDLACLSDMLLESYAYLARRVRIDANADQVNVHSYRLGKMARGTASGGGLYPLSIYWVAGPSAPVPPGIYYYNALHHSLQRLLSGDVSGQVAAALNTEATDRHPLASDQFLVLGAKFWRNAFKYNNFGYHAITMDVGALLQSWRTTAAVLGQPFEASFWFDERRLSHLVGCDVRDEGIFAVVPLPWRGGTRPAPSATRSSVVHRDEERSRRVRRFDLLDDVHRESLNDAADRPAVQALDSARALPPGPGDRIPLGQPEFGEGTLSATLAARHSSFGAFTSAVPLTATQLGSVLAAAQSGAALPCDVSPSPAEGTDLVKSYVFVNHVSDVPQGLYSYDASTHALVAVHSGSYGAFLQRNYFLANYNLEQAAAVVVPTVRTQAVLDSVGPRGYRLFNALVGASAQAVYLASAALGIGCGAALGFDNLSYAEEMDGARSDEVPLLILMVGNERDHAAGCRFDNVREVRA